jgi:hypothetical protein
VSAGVILDIVVVALLCFGGAGGVIISRRLGKLMRVQEELQAALAAFDAAAGKADIALKRLEAGGLAKTAELHAAASKAESLLAELSVMTSAGERIADRIDGAVRDVRRLGAANAAGKPKRAA